MNGHCLGRFWNIGPTQTMYCPGPWLKAGKNEVVVLDLLGPKEAQLLGQALPIYDEQRLDLDFSRRVRAKGTFAIGDALPAARVISSPMREWQEVHFAHSQKGRYLCLEALNADKGNNAAVAELDALDSKGAVLSKNLWKILWVSSEEGNRESGDAENMLDGQPSTHWITEYSKSNPDFPHRVVIDLGENTEISGIRYLPRAGTETPGRIKDYRVYLSAKPFGLTPAP